MTSVKWMAPVVFALALGACASGNCRKNQAHETAAKAPASSEAIMTAKPMDRVRVFKYDGSLQCNQGEGTPVEVMQRELKDIQVYRSEKTSDGQMRIQRCGSLTGQANVYEIDRKDLDQAKKLGFQLWTFE